MNTGKENSLLLLYLLTLLWSFCYELGNATLSSEKQKQSLGSVKEQIDKYKRTNSQGTPIKLTARHKLRINLRKPFPQEKVFQNSAALHTFSKTNDALKVLRRRKDARITDKRVTRGNGSNSNDFSMRLRHTRHRLSRAADTEGKQPETGDSPKNTAKDATKPAAKGPKDFIDHWPVLQNKIMTLRNKIKSSTKSFDSTKDHLIELVDFGDRLSNEASRANSRFGYLDKQSDAKMASTLKKKYRKLGEDIEHAAEVVNGVEKELDQANVETQVRTLERDLRKQSDFVNVDEALQSGWSALTSSLADTTNFEWSVLQEKEVAPVESIYRFGDSPGETTYLDEELENMQQSIDSLTGERVHPFDPDLQKVDEVLRDFLTQKPSSLSSVSEDMDAEEEVSHSGDGGGNGALEASAEIVGTGEGGSDGKAKMSGGSLSVSNGGGDEISDISASHAENADDGGVSDDAYVDVDDGGEDGDTNGAGGDIESNDDEGGNFQVDDNAGNDGDEGDNGNGDGGVPGDAYLDVEDGVLPDTDGGGGDIASNDDDGGNFQVDDNVGNDDDEGDNGNGDGGVSGDAYVGVGDGVLPDTDGGGGDIASNDDKGDNGNNNEGENGSASDGEDSDVQNGNEVSLNVRGKRDADDSNKTVTEGMITFSGDIPDNARQAHSREGRSAHLGKKKSAVSDSMDDHFDDEASVSNKHTKAEAEKKEFVEKPKAGSDVHSAIERSEAGSETAARNAEDNIETSSETGADEDDAGADINYREGDFGAGENDFIDNKDSGEESDDFESSLKEGEEEGVKDVDIDGEDDDDDDKIKEDLRTLYLHSSSDDEWEETNTGKADGHVDEDVRLSPGAGSLAYWQRQIEALDEAERRGEQLAKQLRLYTNGKSRYGASVSFRSKDGEDPNYEDTQMFESLAAEDDRGKNYNDDRVPKVKDFMSEPIRSIVEETEENEGERIKPRDHKPRSYKSGVEFEAAMGLPESVDRVWEEHMKSKSSRYNPSITELLRREGADRRRVSSDSKDGSYVDLFDDLLGDPNEFEYQRHLADVSVYTKPVKVNQEKLKEKPYLDQDTSKAVEGLEDTQKTLKGAMKDITYGQLDDMKRRLENVREIKKKIKGKKRIRKTKEVFQNLEAVKLLEAENKRLLEKRRKQYEQMHQNLDEAYEERQKNQKKNWSRYHHIQNELKKNEHAIDELAADR